jgi:hypothetical protein
MPLATFYAVAGKADTDPLFPDDPFISANRRVTITLMREAAAVPPILSLAGRRRPCAMSMPWPSDGFGGPTRHYLRLGARWRPCMGRTGLMTCGREKCIGAALHPPAMQ